MTEMNTIGFYGLVDLEEVERLEKRGMRFIKEHWKSVYVGIAFLKEQLKDFDVICDCECGYEDGTVEFLIDYKPGYDIEPVKEIIKGLEGVVKFRNFME